MIDTLLSEVVSAAKLYNEAHPLTVAKQVKPDEKIPAFNPVYVDSVEMRDKIAVHSELNVFPWRLFNKKAPNEDPEQFEYRKDNYEPATTPYWNKAQNAINRIWNRQNFEIHWESEEGEGTAKEYFTEDYPSYGSVISYFESIVTRQKINDPNSVLVIRPPYIPTKTNDLGEIVADDTEIMDFTGLIYRCDQVVRFVDENWALILLDEKVKLENETLEPSGLVFEFYDTEAIYRITQVGKKTDYKFEIVIYYTHDWGELPVRKLKGNPIQRSKDILYKSIFFDAVPSLNIALYDSSTLQCCKISHAFKQKWEYVDACSNAGCDSGYISDFENEGRKIKCGVCNGTGVNRKASVMGVMQLQAPTRLSDGDAALPAPPGGYIEEDTTILDFLDNQIDKNISRAFAMCNIDMSSIAHTTQGKPPDETATGRQIDREELFSMMLTVSNELFDLLKWFIEGSGFMRYGSSFKEPAIKPPVDFSIRTEQDLSTEIVTAKEQDMPEVVLRRLVKDYLKTRFSDNDIMTKTTELVFAADVLMLKDDLTIAGMLGAGTIQKWQATLHNNIYSYIDDLIDETPDFLTAVPLIEQKKALQDKAKQDTPTESGADLIRQKMIPA